MILLDTSGLLAALDSSQTAHAEAANCLRDAGSPRLLSPFVLAELDYLITRRVSDHARHALLEEVERDAFQLQSFSTGDLALARAVIARHADLKMSLADASIAVLAEHHQIRDVLTLDERHFRVLTVGGEPFRLLPADR